MESPDNAIAFTRGDADDSPSDTLAQLQRLAMLYQARGRGEQAEAIYRLVSQIKKNQVTVDSAKDGGPSAERHNRPQENPRIS